VLPDEGLDKQDAICKGSSSSGVSGVAVHVFGGARCAYGLVGVVTPERVMLRVRPGPPDPLSRQVARVLAVRHVLQGALTARHPRAGPLRFGATVDAIHGISMMIVALSQPRRRRVALADTVIAVGWACVGLVIAGRTRS